MIKWYLAYTKPRHEDNAASRLVGAGFEVLNPRVLERKLYRRKITDVSSPLFPCYLFVSFERDRDYHLIRYTRGVKRVLGNEDGPAEVPQPVIDSINARLEDGYVRLVRRFLPGERVLIAAGPFEGFEAVFEKELNGFERVSILLRSMNVRLVADGRMLQRL